MAKIRRNTEIPRDHILITTDQIITFEGNVLEKPLDAAEARAFLSGYSHKSCSTVGSIVLTRLLDGKRVEVMLFYKFYILKRVLISYIMPALTHVTQGVDVSTINFKAVPPDTIEALIAQGDVYYSAGALLVESPLMTPCVHSIDGSVDGVLGLSKRLLERLLEDMGSIPHGEGGGV
jgi:septum formation protein